MVVVVAAAAGELRKMACLMSRVREEEGMGQKPNEMFLTPRFQHKSQVLHESTACTYTARASQPVLTCESLT